MLLAANSIADDASLRRKYEHIRTLLQDNVYGIPIYIESRDENHTMQGGVYGILPHTFPKVRQALTTVANWCKISPQHFNIKACTYQTLNHRCQLTFYSGRKFYEAAEDVYQLAYHFDLINDEKDYFRVRLSSDTGPMGTSNYRIEAEAIPFAEAGTFIHFSYAYHDNFFTRLGMKAYLAMLGRNKLGFTIVQQDMNGKPVYVQGIRGIIERNAARYYFAIQSYLDTEDIQTGKRFRQRLNRWFDLTEKYPLQLHEMEMQAYLESKQMEWQNQLRLQQSLPGAKGVNSECTAR